jgi:hypothetical protein
MGKVRADDPAKLTDFKLLSFDVYSTLIQVRLMDTFLNYSEIGSLQTSVSVEECLNVPETFL